MWLPLVNVLFRALDPQSTGQEFDTHPCIVLGASVAVHSP